MATTIQLKRGLSTSWTTQNPVLAAGEVGVETDTRRAKIGDGTTPWNSLGYTQIPIDDELSSTSENPVQNKAVKAAMDGKADKVVNAVEDHLAALDSTGNLTDSEIPASNVAQQDGYYAAQGLGAKTAENLIDPNATPNAASFGFRTSAGEVSISDDSHGQVDKMEGVTHTINQAVKPHASKSMTGDGSIQVTDGTAGNAEGLTLTGDTYVRNQLYKYNWESPSTSSRTITELANQKGSMVTILNPSSSDTVWLRASGKYIVGHTYILSSKVTATYSAQIRPMYSSIATTSTVTVPANTATGISIPFTATGAQNYFIIYYNLSGTAQANDTITFDELQIVDLTRLCSGTALTPSLFTTWDSLKARIPEYASTVAYDTGTVVNSRPGVKVTGKNLFDPSIFTSHGGVLQEDGSYYFQTSSSIGSDTTIVTLTGYSGQVVLRYKYKYNNGTSAGVRVRIKYLDETWSQNYPINDNTWREDMLVSNANKQVKYVAFTYGGGNVLSWIKDLQVELGSVATSYEPYFDGGSAQASADLVSLTNVADTEDVVKGKRTARIASVDMGTLNWTYTATGTYGLWYSNAVASAIKKPATSQIIANILAAKYKAVAVSPMSGNDAYIGCIGINTGGNIYVNTGSTTVAPTGMLYYELATPSVTDITPSQITLQNGNNTVLQTAGSVNRTRLSLGYQGTSYNLTLTKNSKFVKRIDGADSYVSQGSSNGTLAVVGGRDKLFNLTRWFGKGREPASVDAFYKLYPAFKYADVPYTAGALVNFKGASIRTVGFNAYNHATGTARLIGGNEYQVCGTYESVSYVDQWGHAEELRVSSEGIFKPANDGVLTVTGGNGTDTCVHLTWSGYKNYGEPEYKWEPYIENTKELPVATYFPDGMNGIGATHDELTASGYTVRLKTVDLGTLAWGNYVAPSSSAPYGYANCYIQDKAVGYNTAIIDQYEENSGSYSVDKTYTTGGSSNGLWIMDSSLIGMTGTQLKAAFAGKTICYILVEPVVTPINPQLNLTYSVNDFGTEEMLPYPDSITPLSTEFHGYIKYSVDFLRLNIHLNEWYNTIKTLVQNEPNYVLKDKTYDTLGACTAFNLIDRNAQGSGREFTYDTSGGTVDLTDGTAVIKKYEGSTLMQNQLVADTNVNTEDSANGVIEVTDAVTADAKGLTMYGESYVKNQLVSTDPVEKTESSSDGVVSITDGTANAANSLVMKGDSWVRNQWIQDSTFSDSFYSNYALAGNATQSITNGILEITMGDANNSGVICQKIGFSWISGHSYLIKVEARSPNAVTACVPYMINIATVPKVTLTNSWTTYYFRYDFNNPPSDSLGVARGAVVGTDYQAGDKIYCRNFVVVDLTQLCNGDTTKINAIQTWNNLLIQYPVYRSYTSYDTGTVMGITPTVQMPGKNLIDQSRILTDVADSSLTSDGYYTSTVGKFFAAYGPSPHDGWFTHFKPNTQYTVSFNGYASNATASPRLTFRYSDGSSSWTPAVTATTSTFYSHTSTSGKTVVELYMTYGNVGDFFIKDICLQEGTDSTYVVFHSDGTATASAPLFAVGNAADEFEAVSGTRTVNVGILTTSTLSSHALSSNDVNTSGYIRFILFAATKKYGITNVISNRFVTKNTTIAADADSEGISGYNSGEGIYISIKADKLSGDLTTADTRRIAMHNWISANNLEIYYELATPTTSQSTPTQISLQAGDNVAMQTDGGRVADFDLGYDGTDYTLALDSTHKYGLKHGSTGSILTGASSQAVVAGSDMLVDVTRLVNGDSAKVNAITAWSDIVAGYPEYAGYVNYNAGEVKGVTPTVSANGYVRNQLADMNDTILAISGSQFITVTKDIPARTMSFTVIIPNTANGFRLDSTNLPSSHVIAVHGYATCSEGDIYTRFGLTDQGSTASSYIASANTETEVFGIIRLKAAATNHRLYIYGSIYKNIAENGTYSLRDLQIVDLTQLFGGNQARINSIQTWDDLVAAVPAYANYVAYDTGTDVNGGSMTASAPLHGVGTARDTENGVDGKRTAKIGYANMGALTWNYYNAASTGGLFAAKLTDANVSSPTGRFATSSKYYDKHITNQALLGDGEAMMLKSYQTSGIMSLIIRDSSFNGDYSSLKASLNGKYIYYELRDEDQTISSVTPSSISMQQGTNVLTQTDGGRTADFTLDYDGTDYDIATNASRKYIKRINGTDDYVTGGSPVSVRGRRDKLIDLTYMFGAGYEPATLAAFYKLFPTWRGYDIPHDKGSVLNFKGTGIVSVGFNLVDFGGRTLGAPQNTAASNTTVRGPFDETKYYVGFSSNGYYYPNRITSYSVSDSAVSVQNNIGEYGIAFPFRVIPGQVYMEENHVSGVKWSFYTYDGRNIAYFNSHQYVTAPDNAYWCLMLLAPSTSNTTVTWTNPCVHLKWSGTRNGDYEQYWDYTRPLPTLTYFPDGMNGLNAISDEVTSRQAVQRLAMAFLEDIDWTVSDGTWTYQFADMKPDTANIAATHSQSFTLSGNTVTFTSQPTGYLVYELATPVVTVFQDEQNLSYQVSDYGTESILPVNTTTLTTAPLRAMIQYLEDAARTMTHLPENYQSQKSMDAFCQAMGDYFGCTITATYNENTRSYSYSFTANN